MRRFEMCSERPPNEPGSLDFDVYEAELRHALRTTSSAGAKQDQSGQSSWPGPAERLRLEATGINFRSASRHRTYPHRGRTELKTRRAISAPLY
jgi:hypothetical protein